MLHNDDTTMRVLTLERDADISSKRTDVFTSGIVCLYQGHRIAPFFPACKHAGENLAAVLKQRAAQPPAPILMSDALSRNLPELPEPLQIIWAGAPLDNNLVERALKRLFSIARTPCFTRPGRGAEMGDLFMSLIQTCELNGANPFDYLTEFQRHAGS